VDRLNSQEMTLRTKPVSSSAEVDKLTPTQLRVLQGVHNGLANKQIAFNLGIAEATVKAHMTALMRKLNVRNRTQVAILAEKMVGIGLN
jgi:DNA-binding NarL/FixJ family response regulator